MTSTFLPLAAALRARRSLAGDPAGRIAVAWALLGLVDLASLAQYLHHLPRGIPIGLVAITSYVLLFARPLLTWIGPRARATLPIVLGTWTVLVLLAVARLGAEREFRLVVAPLSNAIVAALALGALASVARRAPGDPVHDGRVWVCAGTAEYFLLGVVWKPLTEALVARHWGTLIDLHMGMMLVHTIAYLLIAWGTLRHDDVVVSPAPAAIPDAA